MDRLLQFYTTRFFGVRAPEDGSGTGQNDGAAGTGTGENDDAGASGEGDGGAGNGPPAGQPGDAAPYLPEGIPEHLQGATNEETIDKLFKAETGLRQTLGEKGAVPKAPTDYKLELGEQAAAAFEIADDDPNLTLWQEIAHEHGFTDQQFAAVPKFLEAAVEKGLVPQPADTAELFTSLAPEGTKGSKDEVQAAGALRITGALNQIETLKSNGKFSSDKAENEAMAQELTLMTGTVAGVKALEFMMNQVQKGIDTGGDSSTGEAVTESQINERLSDPKNSFGNPEYDEAFAKQTLELQKRFAMQNQV